MPMPTLQRLKTAMKFRPFFFISFLLTAVFYTLLNTFTDWSWSTNLLISWNIAVSSYLVKTMTTLWSVDHRHILQHAQQQDASKWIMIAHILYLFLFFLLHCIVPKHYNHTRYFGFRILNRRNAVLYWNLCSTLSSHFGIVFLIVILIFAP